MIHDSLRSLIDNRPSGVHLEIRYHQRKNTEIRVDKGIIHTATSDDFAGVGIRSLVDGAWGYASTSSLESRVLKETMNDSIRAAKNLAKTSKEKVRLASIQPVTGSFINLGTDPIENHNMEEIVKIVVDTEKDLRDADKRIKGSMVRVLTPSNHRIILNSDGTDVEIRDTRPEMWLRPTASEGTKISSIFLLSGQTGGWEFFERYPPDMLVDKGVTIATGLLDAPFAKGGKHTVVMEPAVVGLICHEAIGHTVEADLVNSGSAAKGKIGKQVASDEVTLVDSGLEKDGGGWLPVDDAGVSGQKTVIIEKGVMKSYLHSRSSAAHFNVEPTGNERAFEYNVEPLIRMRNTYLTAGTFSRDELIEDIKYGYLLASPGGGQADSTAEFMFQVEEAYEIVNGEISGLVRNVTITGNAYDVLNSVEGVGKDWKLELGGGYCGKGQPARVDGGGGLTKATALVAGEVGGK